MNLYKFFTQYPNYKTTLALVQTWWAVFGF